jgi:GT2 family glycosyltransferase
MSSAKVVAVLDAELPRVTGQLEAPREDEAIAGDTFWLRGRVACEGARVRAVTFRRAGALPRRLPVAADAFAARVPVGRAARGPLAFEVWAELDDGREVRAFARRIFVDRPAAPVPSAREGAGLAWGAARKAWRAFREGRLPLSPARWLRDVRMHVDEWRAARLRAAAARAAANADGAPTADAARARLTAAAAAELRAFLASGAQLDFTPREPPRVSVVLVLWNRAELTLVCLRALAATAAAGVALELVIADNASTDATAALLDRVAGARVLRHAENLGFLRAVNAAAREARGELLLLLNNDAELGPGALAAALDRAAAPDVGAVGGRLVLPDGTLQEAGSIVFSDGGCEGYGRGDSPDAPEYGFARDVDYVSGAFLLTPRARFAELGGFDERYAPAYYEDADYCARLWQRGFRVVYEPRAIVSHYEFASARSRDDAVRMQAERRGRFVAQHAAWLAAQPDRAEARPLDARAHENPLDARTRRGWRILFVDDRVPRARDGSGHPRARDLVDALVARGHFVTVYPTLFDADGAGAPDGVEVVAERGAARLGEFLDARRDYYDVTLVSRPHNMERLRALGGAAGMRVIYDAEAIFALRDARRRRALDDSAHTDDATPERSENAAIDRAVAAEVALAAGADAVLAVTEAERTRFAAIAPAFTVGHVLAPAPTARPFDAREGLLFVGAFYDDASPNADSMFWFVRDVWPRVRERLPIGLTIAGARPTRSVIALGATAGVEVLGAVDDLVPLYEHARVFVAPTRFPAGLPYKVHHAAAHGVPVVATSVLAAALGWRGGEELLVADEPAAFADAVARVYGDRALWERLRAHALERVERDCSPRAFGAALDAALAAIGAP